MFAWPGSENYEPVPLPSVHDAVMAVHERRVERALVPIENSLEGAVNATLDALAFETDDVQITGELVHPIHHCLIAREPVALERIAAVASHPQASGQCATFLRTRLARRRGGHRRLDRRRRAPGRGARGRRAVGGARQPRGRRALRLRGARVGRRGPAGLGDALRVDRAARRPTPARGGAWKTALMFWEPSDDRPGWLVRCLTEFAEREVNLTRIESRPRRRGLGTYMFFVDLDGRADDPAVAAGDRGAALPCRRRAGARLVPVGAHSYTPPGHGDSRTTRPTGVCAARRPPAARTESRRRWPLVWWSCAGAQRDVRAHQRVHRAPRHGPAPEGEGRGDRDRQPDAALGQRLARQAGRDPAHHLREASRATRTSGRSRAAPCSPATAGSASTAARARR